MDILNYISLFIGIIGITVIIWGALLTFLQFLGLEAGRFSGSNICRGRELLRLYLGSYILLGLEFMIAADIIHTLVKPDMRGLAVLGAIVAIRTVISYFLNREVGEIHDGGGSGRPTAPASGD